MTLKLSLKKLELLLNLSNSIDVKGNHIGGSFFYPHMVFSLFLILGSCNIVYKEVDCMDDLGKG